MSRTLRLQERKSHRWAANRVILLYAVYTRCISETFLKVYLIFVIPSFLERWVPWKGGDWGLHGILNFIPRKVGPAAWSSITVPLRDNYMLCASSRAAIFRILSLDALSGALYHLGDRYFKPAASPSLQNPSFSFPSPFHSLLQIRIFRAATSRKSIVIFYWSSLRPWG